jgi:Ca-activated chloride channel family protein
MHFAWPLALASLVVVPLLAGFYVWQLRRRRRRAISYSSVALIRAAAPRSSAWRRHLPVALLLGVLACLGAAAARPEVRTDVPVSRSAVIVAIDVSGSMCATDVDPNRLTAAQDAVRKFVKDQEAHTQIGLVVFSGFAQVAVAPTTDRGEVTDAIDSLTTGRGTAIGAAILKSVDAIAQINPDVTPSDVESGADATRAPRPRRAVPEIVVLLTDGANTSGVTPADAAEAAAERGVRVYPIGFGTRHPTNLMCTAQQLGGSGFDIFGPGGGGLGTRGSRGRNFLLVDEPALKEVASVTGAAYFSASDADQLQGVLEDLPRHVETQQQDVELSVALVGLAALLMLATVVAAVRWSVLPR